MNRPIARTFLSGGIRSSEAGKTEPPGLYIHVPFCKTKCPYCGFYSITDLSMTGPWVDALIREAHLYKDSFGTFDSLYFGGGTPSSLDERMLKNLFRTLQKCFDFSSHCEITFEVNPDDVTSRKLKLLRSLGVNRLSIGVQSFDEKELRFLKRRHTARQAEKAVRVARSCGFDNVGIDLIYGLPGQKESNWVRTMEQAIDFEPTHLSCYQFTLEKGTPFCGLAEQGGLKRITETKERKLFMLTSSFLTDQGFIHYEISNFARKEQFFSRHNQKYWRHVPYLGLGPGAHSFHDGMRWWNHRSVDRYCEALNKAEKPVDGIENLSPEQLRLERRYLGFRTGDGVSRQDLIDGPESEEILRRLQRSRLVRVRDDRIVSTLKGFLVADRLPLMFPG